MEIIYVLTAIFFALILVLFAKLIIVRKVYFSHKLSNLNKYVNDGRFNEAFNLLANPSEEKSFYLRPIVNIEDKNLKSVIFVNNVNSVMLGLNGKLLFELNMTTKDRTDYYFIIDNYKLDGDQTISTNLITNNFPKLFDNNANYYDILNLKDLGYDADVKIKTEDIVAIVFDGKYREFALITNNINQQVFYIKYKSKQEMILKIKDTVLYRHIMQWGIPGLFGSKLTYVDDEVISNKKGEQNEQS